MVKVQVILMARNEHTAPDCCIDEQAVEPLCRVEAVVLALLGGIDDILHGQFGEDAQHGVRAADTETRTLRELSLQHVDVLGAVTAADEVAHHRKQSLPILIAEERAS